MVESLRGVSFELNPDIIEAGVEHKIKSSQGSQEGPIKLRGVTFLKIRALR